jgi:dipeptidyl aminopeptidase/acylaminoacyl peptidase
MISTPQFGFRKWITAIRQLALVFLFGSASIFAAELQADVSTKVPLTPEMFLNEYSSSIPIPSVRWLPNSKEIMFAVPGEDRKTSVIEMLDITTGARRQLTTGSNPQAAPDGTRIAYLRSEKGESQVWIISVDGRDPHPVTRVPRGLGSTGYGPTFAWSPDSEKIAFGFRPVPSPDEARSSGDRKSSVTVVGEPGAVPPDSEIWTVDLGTNDARKIWSGPYTVQTLAWMSRGSALLFAVVGGFEYRNDNVSGEVRTASVSSGRVTTLIKNTGVQALRPSLSPDGSQIAFTSDPNNQVYPMHWRIATISANGGPITHLTGDELYVNSGAIWSRDGEEIFFNCKFGVFNQLCSVTPNHQFKRLTEGARNIIGFSPSPDAQYFAWTTEDAQGRQDIRVAKSDFTQERVLLDLAPNVDKLALGKTGEIRWKSRDGLDIAGLLIRPVGFEAGKKYPLLVDLHGGPVGGVRLSGSIVMTSPLEWQVWAAKGFVVLVPDYRSSVVYGWDQVLQAREKQDANVRDFNDIMSGVDHVISMGSVDPTKLILVGHSYGGVLTNWIITHSHRFKVAVSYEGTIDQFTAYGTGARVGGNSIMEWLHKGKPWEVPGNYRINSSMEYLKGMTTPTLLVSGSKGLALYHNEFLYTALRKQGIDTRFLVYTDEPHVISRPENQRDLLMRVIEWVDSHLKSEG